MKTTIADLGTGDPSTYSIGVRMRVRVMVRVRELRVEQIPDRGRGVGSG